MLTLTITSLDPSTAPAPRLDPLIAATHAQRVASVSVDLPFEPAETVAAWRAHLVAHWSGDPQRLLIATDPEDNLLGHAVVSLPMHDNVHLGQLELHVGLDQRRRGVGRALFDQAVTELREHGRRAVIAEAREDSPMAAFAAAMGAEPKLVDIHRQQRIAELDLEQVRELRVTSERAARDYRTERWRGVTPEHRRADMAHAAHALNDAPLGDLDLEDERWDAERVELRDRFMVEARLRLYGMLALAPDDSPAGYTELGVSEDGTFGWQFGTGVARDHRGHRLGMLLKASMVEWLRASEPDLRVVSTWNAEVNDHMIAINEALGYVPVDKGAQWQLGL